MSIYKKILFPTDFSPGARHALSHALKLVDVQEGEIIVQHVVSDYFERLPHWTTIFDVHELQKRMDGYVAGEMKRIVGETGESGLKIRPTISKGRPAEEINAASEEEMVDLIVMGPSGGAVTSQVIEEGSRPVMAVPREDRNGAGCRMVQRILVTVDFSHRSRKLVDHAFRLREALGATVYMLYVIEATCSMEVALREAYFSNALDRMREWAFGQLANMTPTAFISDPNVHRIVEVGRSAEVIAKVTREVGADLIAIGVQDHRRLDRYLISANTDRTLPKSASTILALPF